MSNIKDISKLVKEARINKGYSARELAKLCDISHTEINNIEKGERVRPAVLTLKAFEKYLDLDFKELATLVGYSKDSHLSKKNSAQVRIGSRWWECELVPSLWKIVWRFLRKLKIVIQQSHPWGYIRTKL